MTTRVGPHPTPRRGEWEQEKWFGESRRVRLVTRNPAVLETWTQKAPSLTSPGVPGEAKEGARGLRFVVDGVVVLRIKWHFG